MKTTTRIPQAPAAALPELADFLRPYDVHFTRSEGRHALERYLTGLFTEHPNKNCDTIAQVVPDTSEQSLQGLLTNMVWDEDDLNRQRVEQMMTLPAEADAVLVFDDTGFAKQGNCSVGVQRQYSGTLGKKGNCQITVNCHYSERTLAWPVATRLYLPKVWANDPPRCHKARVPADVTFQTKPAIALALLDWARDRSVPHVCITADADYGDNPNFLDGLDLRRERHVVAVRCDFRVALGRGSSVPSQRADVVVAAQPAKAWRSVRWREGTKGWLKAPFVAVRCWRMKANGKRRAGWLIGEDSSDGKRRYYWSNLGPTASLAKMVGYAHRRHWVEQYHQEAKTLLGWDQYQGRLWPGFHRNAVAVMLAYSFLVWQEVQQRPKQRRRGRPRRPFSPSARSPAHVPARGTSPHLRLATRAGSQGMAVA
jgi:SRSO17 transposase